MQLQGLKAHQGAAMHIVRGITLLLVRMVLTASLLPYRCEHQIYSENLAYCRVQSVWMMMDVVSIMFVPLMIVVLYRRARKTANEL